VNNGIVMGLIANISFCLVLSLKKVRGKHKLAAYSASFICTAYVIYCISNIRKVTEINKNKYILNYLNFSVALVSLSLIVGLLFKTQMTCELKLYHDSV
jgi:hypothetical protein